MLQSENEAIEKIKQIVAQHKATITVGSREFDSPNSQLVGKLTFWIQTKKGNMDISADLVRFCVENRQDGWFYEGSEVTFSGELEVDTHRVSTKIGYRI